MQLKCITRMVSCKWPWCHSRHIWMREMAANHLCKGSKWCSRAEHWRKSINQKQILTPPKEVIQISLELQQWTRSRFTLNVRSVIDSAVANLYPLSSMSTHVQDSSNNSSTTIDFESSQAYSPAIMASTHFATLPSFSKLLNAKSSSGTPISTLTKSKLWIQRNSLPTTHSRGARLKRRINCKAH